MEHKNDNENREQSEEKEEKEKEEEINEEKMQEKEDNNKVEIVENEEELSYNQRSRANTNALMTAKGYVTLATLKEELQCIICQYTIRVCLLDSLLTRPIEEAKCSICRVDLLQPFVASLSLTSMFSINVTLWNLGQLLIPSVAERIQSYHQEEEQKFSSKLDQLDAKWKVFTLSERAAKYHGDEEQEHTRSSGRWEEDHIGNEEYPVLKVEDNRDGNLHITRNIVLDTSDENEDGYANMRVGIAIVEFPNIFELYNEHQECSVNVIKMEEDEEMAYGLPFFMNGDGDDDDFVCSSYYNEISLHVCDEAGNCVMERTRGAQGGVVTFPGLRLDVPGGMYTFRFSDDLYGLKLSITTRLREPHEISDTPLADFFSFIHDDIRDICRWNCATHHDSDSESESDEEGSESDDSFIVDDCIGEEHNEQPVGRFSDDDGDDHVEYHSDDEATDEKTEQLRTRRRQRSSRQSERDVPIVKEHHDDDSLSSEEGERSDEQENMDEREEDEESDDEVRPGRRNVRVVEGLFSSDEEADPKEHDSVHGLFSSDGEADQKEHDSVNGLFSSDGEADQKEHDIVDGEAGHDSVDAAKETKTEEEKHDVVRLRQRNANQIVDNDDEDEGKGEPVESDEAEKVNDDSGGVQNDHDEERTEHSTDGASHSVAVEDQCSEENVTVASNVTRKVNRAQRFQDGQSDKEVKADAEDGISERRPRKRSRKCIEDAEEETDDVLDDSDDEEENEEKEDEKYW
ncbi:hypothetical protein DD238_000894 [Peronospora effusa]|uniref:Uncharacterized protein n=1 Tax=Peronospora effusa TaxID=542832 RepID=A0A3M6VTC9_9STRA|nr:hypothetical protein DD238_000894 [Peronospora effusa]